MNQQHLGLRGRTAVNICLGDTPGVDTSQAMELVTASICMTQFIHPSKGLKIRWASPYPSAATQVPHIRTPFPFCGDTRASRSSSIMPFRQTTKRGAEPCSVNYKMNAGFLKCEGGETNFRYDATAELILR